MLREDRWPNDLLSRGCASREADGTLRRQGHWEWFHHLDADSKYGALHQLQADGEYRDGDPGASLNSTPEVASREGLWIFRDSLGFEKGATTYHHGMRDGRFKSPDEGEGAYRGGRREGLWTQDSGGRKFETLYWHDQVWRWTEWNGDGTMESQWVREERGGSTTHWFPSGRMESRERISASESTLQSWYENGQLRLERTRNPSGTSVKEWDERGQPIHRSPPGEPNLVTETFRGVNASDTGDLYAALTSLFVQGGDLPAPAKLLKRLGLDAKDVRDPDANLLVAAITGDSALARRALSMAAKPDGLPGEPSPVSVCRDSSGNITPLTVAVHFGHRDVASLLLERGARPDCRVHQGPAPYFTSTMMVAIYRKQNDILKLLIDHGADVNYTCHLHYAFVSYLKLAAKAGNFEAFEILLSNGADVARQEARFGTADWRIAETTLAASRPEFVERLLRGGYELPPALSATYGVLRDDLPRIVDGVLGDGDDIRARNRAVRDRGPEGEPVTAAGLDGKRRNLGIEELVYKASLREDKQTLAHVLESLWQADFTTDFDGLFEDMMAKKPDADTVAVYRRHGCFTCGSLAFEAP
ncbi:MAG: hypothetical protein QM765_46675 [Myxococcales bacterium]